MEGLMTFEEVKSRIRDYGFEENSTMNEAEYKSYVINAVNLAQNWVYKAIVQPFSAYFENVAEVDVEDAPTPITENTDDDFEIELPEKVIDLVPLMAAYFVWLDDDERKATMYWNIADQLREQLMQDMTRPQSFKIGSGKKGKSVIGNGLRWS